MPVTAETHRLVDRLRRDLTKVTDAQARDLVKAWATAWDEVAPDLNTTLLDMLVAGEQVTRAQLLRSERLRKALAHIATQLEGLARDSQVRIVGDLQGVVDTAGHAQRSVIDSQLPPRHDVDLKTWAHVDGRQIDAIVERTTEQITALHRPLSGEAYAAVRRELIRGVAAGSNPRDTARRMVARAEGWFNGGLNRALTIARTETLDAHRAAAAEAHRANADVLRGWEWQASRDSRTCPACVSMDGTEHKLSEDGPLGHQNCRCARVPLTKSWADLGFTGVAEPAPVARDSGAWFAGLSRDEQVGILGQTGHAAWSRGEFPMSDWARRRKTAGWRDSYVPAKPPSSRRSRGRVAA